VWRGSGVGGGDLVEPLLQRVPRERGALDPHRELDDTLQRLEIAQADTLELGGEIAAVVFASWIDISALNARMSCCTSGSGLPLIAAPIIDVEAWLIEQPWPAILMSCTTSVPGSSSM
jgi:hypothetical protein